MSNPKTLQHIPTIQAEPMLSVHPWGAMPPAGFVVLADHSLGCPHLSSSCCARCADAHREIVPVFGKFYWMASEADFAELVSGRGDAERAAPLDHEIAVRATARADADSLDFEPPGFDRAAEVHTDRSDDEAPSPLELAIDALGRDEAARIYVDEWDNILAECDEPLLATPSCDHAEWGPACPFCNAPAMAIEPGKPGRKYLIIRYDVTDLTEEQIDGLAGAAIVQAEASDNDETPCGECEACLAPHGGEPQRCRATGVNWPDVEAEQVEVLTC